MYTAHGGCGASACAKAARVEAQNWSATCQIREGEVPYQGGGYHIREGATTSGQGLPY